LLKLNGLSSYGGALDPDDIACFGVAAARRAEDLLWRCPAHSPTRLHSLAALASELGVASLCVKDESTRLELGSFKALGGAYAVLQLFLEEAARRLGRAVAPEEVGNSAVRAIAAQFKVACATDGNHGRSVAAGARFLGAQAVIFMHEGVSAARVDAVRHLGAQVRRIRGTYDDAVEAAARESEANGWTIVSDTSWPGYERIPKIVAQGYTVMVQEALREMPAPPTHVFVQAGVGGLASAVAAHLAVVYGTCRPTVTVVEPLRAACLYASHEAGRVVRIPAGEPTLMAMLECQQPSLVAWSVLSRAADAFMTVDEEDAMRAMRRLAAPSGGDPAVVAGESGGAGLAGLLVAAADAGMREALKLTPGSSVLVFNTEGATDPQAYLRIVGRSAKSVASRR
jgi:diaminopropionate ammonia-lyase